MEVKTVLLLVHLAGLVLGLGGVVVLDLYLMRFLRGASVREADGEFVRFVARLVSLGLVLLWASGLGFLAEYWTTDPRLLTNGKVHAKLVIVFTLTVNGMVVHARVLPLFARNLGRGLFDGLTPQERLLTFGCAAVSATGWYAAFVLGAVRELNFVAPVGMFLVVYLAMLGLAASSAVAVAARLRVDPPTARDGAARAAVAGE